MVAFCALSMLPDADVIGFRLGIAYGDPLGHRGASHSFVFALAVAAVLAALSRVLKLPPARVFLFTFIVIASHGLLDSLTDGGLGVALLWPFSHERFFAPFQPIPVAPIGAGMVSLRGAKVVGVELLYFFPLFAWALWPRRQTDAAVRRG
jgi:inner membrane protein